MTESVRGLKRELLSLRAAVKGKDFESHPELFKDIEGVKAKIAFHKSKNKQA